MMVYCHLCGKIVMGQRFPFMIVFTTGSILCLASLCFVNSSLCAHTSSFFQKCLIQIQCTHFLVVTEERNGHYSPALFLVIFLAGSL